MNVTSLLTVVGIVALACAAVYVFCLLYERVVARHRKAAADAVLAREEGYVFIPDLLEAYAFNDVRGIFRVLENVILTLHDPVQRRAHREAFLRRQLEKACQDTEKLKKVAEVVSQYAPAVAAINAAVAAAVPVSAPVTAPVAAAATAAAAAASNVG